MNEVDQRKQQEKLRHMTTDPVGRLVCRLAIPTIISMMVSAMYNMADTYFVGQLGTSATGAVGISFSMMALIQALGFFFGHGSGNYISRALGAQKTGEAETMASVGFYLAVLTGIIVAVTGILFLEPLALLLGATDTILPYACEYLRYVLLAAPFMCGTLVLNNQLRFQGSALYGMIGICSGAVLNIILDPVFIFVLDLGVSGAALATMVSQIVGCMLLFFSASTRGGIPIRFAKFTPRLFFLKEIARGGIPSLFRQGLGSVAGIALNQIAGGYGDAAIAAISIVNRVMMFASSALIGFGQGFQPVCGFNYGAKLYGRVRQAFWFCIKSSFIVLLATGAVLFLFSPQVIALFRADDAEVIRIGSFALRMQCFMFPLMGWVVFCNMMMQTIGKTFQASILAMSRQCLFFLPALLILVPLTGLTGVQLAQPVADLASFILALPLGLNLLREMKRQEQTR